MKVLPSLIFSFLFSPFLLYGQLLANFSFTFIISFLPFSLSYYYYFVPFSLHRLYLGYYPIFLEYLGYFIQINVCIFSIFPLTHRSEERKEDMIEINCAPLSKLDVTKNTKKELMCFRFSKFDTFYSLNELIYTILRKVPFMA